MKFRGRQSGNVHALPLAGATPVKGDYRIPCCRTKQSLIMNESSEGCLLLCYVSFFFLSFSPLFLCFSSFSFFFFSLPFYFFLCLLFLFLKHFTMIICECAEVLCERVGSSVCVCVCVCMCVRARACVLECECFVCVYAIVRA